MSNTDPMRQRALHWPFQDPPITVSYTVVGGSPWIIVAAILVGVVGTLCGVLSLIAMNAKFFAQLFFAALLNTSFLAIVVVVALLAAGLFSAKSQREDVADL